MKQAIVILLKKDRKIEKVRKDKKYRPHITLVYVFQNKDQKELIQHIKEAIKGIKSFNLSYTLIF